MRISSEYQILNEPAYTSTQILKYWYVKALQKIITGEKKNHHFRFI